MNKKLLLFLSFLCFGTINAQTPSEKKTNRTVNSITSPIQNSSPFSYQNSENLPLSGFVNSQTLNKLDVSKTDTSLQPLLTSTQLVQQQNSTFQKSVTSSNSVTNTSICITGDTTAYTTSNVQFSPNFILCEKFTVTNGGFLQNLSLIGTGSNSGVMMVLYQDEAGAPANLVAASGFGITTSGVVQFPINGSIYITPGDYWIGAIYQNSGNNSNIGLVYPHTTYYKQFPYGDQVPSTGSSFSPSNNNYNFSYWMEVDCSPHSITTDLLSATTICTNNNLTVSYTAEGDYYNNIFSAQISDALGDFTNAQTIGIVTSTTSGSINCTIPSNLPPGNAYRIRVISNGPPTIGTDNGINVIITTTVTPTFGVINPFCAGDTSIILPTISTNGITGTWSPALDITTSATYTFTPDAGQCATTATLDITVNPIITSTFDTVNPICAGTALTALPTTSNNGFNGTWSPALDNTTTTTYTFTPDAGQCATTATLDITVNPIITPTFNSVNPICFGDTSLVLPSNSTNGISGNWSPAIDFYNSATYTFTPDAGQCAATTTIDVTVNAITQGTFASVSPICAGAPLADLPTTATNGISGTWSPAMDNMNTTTYTFTPDSGNCIITTPLTVIVNQLPAITALADQTAANCSTPIQLSTSNVSSINNYTVSSIPYAPVTGTPNPGPTGDDYISDLIPLGFNFPFYNNTYSSVKISTNGFISFNPNAGQGCCSGQYLPNNDTDTYNNIIALAWTDLWTYNGGSIEYFNLTNPNRFVVHYNNVSHFAGNAPQVDAEIILYETGEIEMHNTAVENIGGMTQGVENSNGTLATVIPNRNATGWSSYLESYRFNPVFSNTYAWTPTTNMNDATINNPLVSSISSDTTFNVTVTDTSGCSNTSSVSVSYTPNTVPSFDTLNPICAGTALTALPTTSNNGITGTWSPALDNMNTTTYTFTPDAGQCADTTTLTISVNPLITPTFDAVNPFCTGDTSLALPLISNNGITGSWSPALDYTTSATYTFTADAGQCANIATLAITVNPIVTPTFNPINPICAGDTTLILPLVSNNGITGTWSPVLDNTNSGTYTFTPDAGQCAVTTTLSITVNPIITPAFDAVNPICAGEALSALPTLSNNGVSGTWSPAVDNTTSGTYTFTPDAGQCAITATLDITVNPIVTPTFDAINPSCAGDTSWSLPTVSTNGIAGYWNTPLDYNNSAIYTFTPDAGQCAANTTTVSVTIIPVTIPTFDSVNPICANAPLMALPTTSNNGVSGTWSPALDNTTTTTYFFTADSGVCIATVPLTIAVNPLPAANATSTATAVACNTPFTLNTTPPSITNYTLTSIPYAPVTGTPNPGPTGDDNISGMIPLGFDFPFYNNTFNSVKISTNGFISFNPNAQNGCCSGQYLPNGDTNTFNNVIALSWTDLWTYNGGSIEYFNLTNPNRFVVHYNNTPHFSGSTPQVNAEIILYETGEIEMHNTAIENIGTMTQGIENGDGSAATVVPGRNSTGWNSYLEAYRFTPVSTNTTTYAWTPATNMDNAAIQSPQVSSINADTTYTVTVTDVNGCMNTSSVTVAYIPNTVPSFDPIAPSCFGDTSISLPTTSTNGITGTWSPALDYTTSATYTFTPDAGQCADTTTLGVVITPLTAPTFNAVAPICIGDTTLTLATTATNGITGTWSPALDNTTSATYTFTPDAGQCAATTTLDVTVNSLTTPTFDAVAPICIGDTTLTLATTATNGITGTWSPALDNTTSATYTFTPDAGQCAATTTLDVTVNSLTTPTFDAVAPICIGDTTLTLATTATNGITGTWSPALDNTTSATYTFTPDAGQCAATTTLDVTVNPLTVPTFDAVAPFCSGDTSLTLATTATNGITGTWSPALDYTTSATYTFTPDAGQCAATTTLDVTVNPLTTPTFDAVAPVCNGSTLTALPTTATNGISGTWSPTLDNTATTTYTFTPNSGVCTTTASLTITVTTTAAPTGATTQFFNETNTINDIVVDGTNIIWYPTAQDASNQTNALSTSDFLVDGATYYATQTVDGCTSTSALAVTITVTLGVQTFGEGHIAISPNPVSTMLFIMQSNHLPIDKITLYDVTGKLILSQTQNTNQLNVENFADGMYIIEATAGDQKFISKFIKK
ncbi:T9SS type A sorting domain-containing protein [Flavobacterium sp. SUN046]|uniref:T9SS type A sorting domain-containing protein n=1 Tax=Flavobacterium sp. SUN046 TaxID=3002440 RepID=UPI002DBF16CE|nr:T9SS type A sorting domain-containing protein [Flavobacterium sp. SUN046]MEC4049154.1 T9SS type A sorting domain-containing protein [Flavobacterium sp. SUN046]